MQYLAVRKFRGIHDGDCAQNLRHAGASQYSFRHKQEQSNETKHHSADMRDCVIILGAMEHVLDIARMCIAT